MYGCIRRRFGSASSSLMKKSDSSGWPPTGCSNSPAYNWLHASCSLSHALQKADKYIGKLVGIMESCPHHSAHSLDVWLHAEAPQVSQQQLDEEVGLLWICHPQDAAAVPRDGIIAACCESVPHMQGLHRDIGLFASCGSMCCVSFSYHQCSSQVQQPSEIRPPNHYTWGVFHRHKTAFQDLAFLSSLVWGITMQT